MAKDIVGQIYLIHFDEPINPEHPARHYLGWALDWQERFKNHNARLMQVARERGITCHVVRVWEGTRNDERRLKNRKNAPCLCPHCSPKPAPVSYLTPMEVSL